VNACAAIEKALVETLKRYSGLYESPAAAAVNQESEQNAVWIVSEQNEEKDPSYSQRIIAERWFPQVRITATPEGADDNGWTFQQPVSITIGTHSDDDPHGTQRAEIYDAVRHVVSALYFQMLDPTKRPGAPDAGDEIAFFLDQFSGALPQGWLVTLGGITLPANSAPGLAGLVQTIGISMTFHWFLDPTTINAQ
jgi:hypothetical protein